MSGDGSEEMPLTELAEYQAYLEWRDTCCPTSARVELEQLHDVLDQLSDDA